MTSTDDRTVSVILPCLNEVATIGSCIENAFEFLAICGLLGEVLVIDNGSSDGSVSAARMKGARVFHEPRRGYGNACRRGLLISTGKFIIIGDSDGTYNFIDAVHFLGPLQDGFDLVIGSRLRGDIVHGSMPWLHRYIGVPFLTWLLNRVTGLEISDAHCGLRALTRESVSKLKFKSAGMEFASEMILEAAKEGLKVLEVPVSYKPRQGLSKLRPVRDGVRHLQILTAYDERSNSRDSL
jgi:glycosyltransferase involved in cell wall biosynthesis